MSHDKKELTKKPRILVIDDDENIQRLLAVILDGRGYEIVPMRGPVDGLESASQKKPDLIILDILMEPIDGFGVLAQIRQKFSSAQLPVLMLSIADRMKDIDMAYGLGASAYITKPIDLIKLQKKVAALLFPGPQVNAGVP